MTPKRATKLPQILIGISGEYSRNAARVTLSEVSLKLGQDALDRLIRELKLEEIYGFNDEQMFLY